MLAYLQIVLPCLTGHIGKLRYLYELILALLYVSFPRDCIFHVSIYDQMEMYTVGLKVTTIYQYFL